MILSRAQIKKLEPRLLSRRRILRIPESKNILDNTGVHPESYKEVETLNLEMNLDESAFSRK